MGMTRGTALVLTKARLVQLTGVQHLANLEASGELTLTDLLVTASDAIYDQLEGDGSDPTLLTNQTAYERAVAWHFLALVVISGQLRVPGLEPPKNEKGQTDPYAWSDPHYRRVKPQFSSGDAPRHASEGIPAVGHIDERPLSWFSDDFPSAI